MKIKPIRIEKDYKAAMKRIDALIAVDPKEGTPEFDELDIISTLVESYENEHYPIDAPDPVKALIYILEEKGMERKELAKYVGSKSKLSEILNRKRELSKRMIKSLHDNLGIPYEILMA